MKPIEINGTTYKIGLRGMVYALWDDDWVRSHNYTPEELAHYQTKLVTQMALHASKNASLRRKGRKSDATKRFDVIETSPTPRLRVGGPYML